MRLFRLLFVLFVMAPVAFGQVLPSKIRGYSVHKTPIVMKDVVSDNEANERSAIIKVSEPTLVEFSLTGVTFDLTGEVVPPDQSGRVDFLTFHDFHVNGVAVEIEEYAHPFAFRKNEVVQLPKPARVFLPTSGLIKAAWKEMHESQDEWIVSGRVLVFGKFRKYGFYHKRVVPVDVSVRIKNPLID